MRSILTLVLLCLVVGSNATICNFSDLQPHPTDCNKFLQCDHGVTYTKDCAPGTWFVYLLQRCDVPWAHECALSTTTGVTQTTVTEVTTVETSTVTTISSTSTSTTFTSTTTAVTARTTLTTTTSTTSITSTPTTTTSPPTTTSTSPSAPTTATSTTTTSTSITTTSTSTMTTEDRCLAMGVSCFSTTGCSDTIIKWEDDEDCRMYYTCAFDCFCHIGCPGDQVFNPDTLQCDKPGNVPSCVDDEMHASVWDLESCIFLSDCSGIAPNPHDCPDLFRKCSNGWVCEMRCDAGLVYDPNVQDCVPGIIPDRCI